MPIKNLASTGIARGPSRDSRTHTITCPICKKYKIELERLEQKKSLAMALNVAEAEWTIKSVDGSQITSPAHNWQGTMKAHIDNHSTIEVIQAIYELDNQNATLAATVDSLNTFLDAFAAFIYTRSTTQKSIFSDLIRNFALRGPSDGKLPEQFRPLATDNDDESL